MELTLSDELTAVAELARTIGLEKLSPTARDVESAGVVGDDAWSTLVESGLTAMVDDDHGGDGVTDAVTHVIAAEGFAYGDPGIAAAALWSGAAAMLLSTHGTPAQAELARDLLSETSARGSVAIHEGFGRGPSEWTTTVRVEPDRSVRVRGTKVGVPFAHSAGVIVVVGRDPDAHILRAAVVPADHPGVVRHDVAGSIGLNAAPTSTIDVDVTLPDGAVLGGVALDANALALSVERIRLLTAAIAIGTAQRAIDYASAYATERVAFGRPIAGFQGVSFLLADKQIKVEVARLEVLKAAAMIDTGASAAKDLECVGSQVRDAINYAAEAATMATRDAVQVLGGHGFITDHPVELWYRSAAALSALDFDPICSTFAPVL